MRTKIERTLKKPKNKASKWLGNLTEKLRPKKNVAYFSISNINLLTTELYQIQTHSNPAIRAEVERQKNNGVIYANITRFA